MGKENCGFMWTLVLLAVDPSAPIGHKFGLWFDPVHQFISVASTSCHFHGATYCTHVCFLNFVF